MSTRILAGLMSIGFALSGASRTPGVIRSDTPQYGVAINSNVAPSYSAGFFTINTGSDHPVTRFLGCPGDIGAMDPDCFRCTGAGALNHAAIRSYDSDRDYLLIPQSVFPMQSADGFECTEAARPLPISTTQVFEGGRPVGVEAQWSLDRDGDVLAAYLKVVSHADDVVGAYVEVAVTVRNSGLSPAHVGIRDVLFPRATAAITPANPLGLGTIGVYYTGFRPPDPPVEPFILNEVERTWPTERMWQRYPAFSAFPSLDRRSYSVAGTLRQPLGLQHAVTPPHLFQVAAANRLSVFTDGGLMDRCFEWHVPDPPRTVASVNRDEMAVAYTWGLTEETALEIPPGGEVSVSQYLVAFLEYPLSARADGPHVADCEGFTTRVPVHGEALPLEPTTAPTAYAWSSPDPRVTFEDAAAADTVAIVQGAGTFPVEFRTGIGVYEASAQTTVTVVDSVPPVIDNLRVMPTSLWPPDHRMVPVRALVHASDACDPEPSVRLVRVSSSEPSETGAGGDGSTMPDIDGAEIGTDDREVLLRAERMGRGVGRTYTLTYEARDASGNVTQQSIDVSVAHDQSRRARGRRP